jgi:polyisoprenoid-binding protein YceI
MAIALAIPVKGFAQVINADSSLVTFELSNLAVNTVEGTMKGFEGEVLFDAGDLSKSSFDVCIDPATVNSGIEARDKALLEEDYFDTERHPRICFQSDDIIMTEEGYLSRGTLTIKGISREVSIPFVAEGNRLTGAFEIKRTDYDVGPSSGFLVGKTIELEIICVMHAHHP